MSAEAHDDDDDGPRRPRRRREPESSNTGLIVGIVIFLVIVLFGVAGVLAYVLWPTNEPKIVTPDPNKPMPGLPPGFPGPGGNPGAPAAPPGDFAIGTVAPEIEGKDTDGKEFKLSDYRGKVVVLDFWGHW